MRDTIGTLNLKIARLQHQLEVIQQRQRLSLAYPQYYAGLMDEGAAVENQLRELKLRREELSRMEDFWKGELYGHPGRQKSFFAFN